MILKEKKMLPNAISNQAFEKLKLKTWKYSVSEIMSARYISAVWAKTKKQIHKQKKYRIVGLVKNKQTNKQKQMYT